MSTIENGIHLLSGVENVIISGQDVWCSEDINGVALIIDGITYVAYEDPDDGYRSYGSFYRSNVEVKNTFPAQRVEAVNIEWDAVDDYGWESTGEKLILIDCVTHEVILEVGTDTSDHYYPMAIFHWYPENMAINR